MKRNTFLRSHTHTHNFCQMILGQFFQLSQKHHLLWGPFVVMVLITTFLVTGDKFGQWALLATPFIFDSGAYIQSWPQSFEHTASSEASNFDNLFRNMATKAIKNVFKTLWSALYNVVRRKFVMNPVSGWVIQRKAKLFFPRTGQGRQWVSMFTGHCTPWLLCSEDGKRRPLRLERGLWQ